MAWRWSDQSWTPQRLDLAHAVYKKTRRESAYAPMLSPLGSGNLLLRGFDRRHIGAAIPEHIDEQVVLESIKVRDAQCDQNRFSGPLPANPRVAASAAVAPLRGGLYCSEDIRAAMAEQFHYAEPNLSRSLIGQPARLDSFLHRCFVSLRAVGELQVVSLNGDSPAMLPFLAVLEKDAAVAQALAALRYKDLFEALYAEQDYAAARGLGLGLESNPEIDGLQVISARDYETEAAGQRVMRTGDNVVLFGINQRRATDKVRVQALHLVDAVPGSRALSVTHYKRAGAGQFRKSGAAQFDP